MSHWLGVRVVRPRTANTGPVPSVSLRDRIIVDFLFYPTDELLGVGRTEEGLTKRGFDECKFDLMTQLL